MRPSQLVNMCSTPALYQRVRDPQHSQENARQQMDAQERKNRLVSVVAGFRVGQTQSPAFPRSHTSKVTPAGRAPLTSVPVAWGSDACLLPVLLRQSCSPGTRHAGGLPRGTAAGWEQHRGVVGTAGARRSGTCRILVAPFSLLQCRIHKAATWF